MLIDGQESGEQTSAESSKQQARAVTRAQTRLSAKRKAQGAPEDAAPNGAAANGAAANGAAPNGAAGRDGRVVRRKVYNPSGAADAKGSAAKSTSGFGASTFFYTQPFYMFKDSRYLLIDIQPDGNCLFECLGIKRQSYCDAFINILLGTWGYNGQQYRDDIIEQLAIEIHERLQHALTVSNCGQRQSMLADVFSKYCQAKIAYDNKSRDLNDVLEEDFVQTTEFSKDDFFRKTSFTRLSRYIRSLKDGYEAIAASSEYTPERRNEASGYVRTYGSYLADLIALHEDLDKITVEFDRALRDRENQLSYLRYLSANQEIFLHIKSALILARIYCLHLFVYTVGHGQTELSLHSSEVSTPPSQVQKVVNVLFEPIGSHCDLLQYYGEAESVSSSDCSDIEQSDMVMQRTHR